MSVSGGGLGARGSARGDCHLIVDGHGPKTLNPNPKPGVSGRRWVLTLAHHVLLGHARAG